MKISATKRITALGVFAAISVILTYLIRFPIFPAASFLEYDPADVTILITAFIFGPAWGVLLTFCVAAIQAMTVSASSGIIGFFMHFIATGAFSAVAGLIYRRLPDIKGSVIALIAGVLTMTAVMIPLNLIFTPMYGVPIDAVKQMIVPVIVPFNLIKAGINAAITLLLYKRTGSLIRGK
ncbi:MAG: ECF transporter S component [Bacillota bacterium]|nr:ECF transporter S component [Bacillota bacterium]